MRSHIALSGLDGYRCLIAFRHNSKPPHWCGRPQPKADLAPSKRGDPDRGALVLLISPQGEHHARLERR
jgi:hypothetical protein